MKLSEKATYVIILRWNGGPFFKIWTWFSCTWLQWWMFLLG